MLVLDSTPPAIHEECTTTDFRQFFRDFVPTPTWAVADTRRTFPFSTAGGIEDMPTHDVERLLPLLREAAQTRDPIEILARAATHFFQALTPTEGRTSTLELATALADLSVTGRTAWASFRERRPVESQLLKHVQARVGTGPSVTRDNLLVAIRRALDRAYAVARALRGPAAGRHAARAGLGWIAVSGEDDLPHRPVNVPSAPYPQHEIDVIVPAPGGPVEVSTRFAVIAPTSAAPSRPLTLGPVIDTSGFLDQVRSLPAEDPLRIPDDHEVILFLHGHSSRLEECLELATALFEEAGRTGRRYAIVAMDLPCSGYSSRLDHARFEAPATPQLLLMYPNSYAALDFVEAFVVAFVEALDRQTKLAQRIVAVIGGSLGGNLGLRLAERTDARPWMRQIVSWSPASLWNPNVDPTTPLNPAGHAEAIGLTETRMNEQETPSARHDYFVRVFQEAHELVFARVPPQPLMWYRDQPSWEPCKGYFIRGAGLDRVEIYDPQFRRWHWRLAGEQLQFSHRAAAVRGGPPRYTSIRSRLLLMAGEQDNYNGAHIHDNTRDIARALTGAAGRAVLLTDTGHSIQAERPRTLAVEISRFLDEPRPGQWRSLPGSIVSAPSVGVNLDGRLEVFALGLDAQVWHAFQREVDRPDLTDWAPLPGGVGFMGGICVARDTETGFELFVLGRDGQIHHRWQGQPNAVHLGQWSGWASLGGAFMSEPVVVTHADTMREVYAIQTDGTVARRRQNLGGAGWSLDWERIDTRVFKGRLAAETDTAGRAHVVARALDDTLWIASARGPNAVPGPFVPFNGATTSGDPVIAKNVDGRLEVFLRGSGLGEVWHTWQRSTSDPSFQPWQQLHAESTPQIRLAPEGRVAATLAGSGRLRLAARDESNGLFHKNQTLSPPFWSSWQALSGTSPADPAIATMPSGRVAVFVRGSSGALAYVFLD